MNREEAASARISEAFASWTDRGGGDLSNTVLIADMIATLAVEVAALTDQRSNREGVRP